MIYSREGRLLSEVTFIILVIMKSTITVSDLSAGALFEG